MTLASRFRYWLPLLPLLALLGFVYWLDNQVQQEVIAAARSLRHDPDGIMDNFSATTMSGQGVPRMLLSAKQMRHFPDDDSTELELPLITMLSPERPTVFMNGLRGNISSRGDEVILRDKVRVLREAAGTQSAMTLHTEYLRVLPNKEWADSDQAVVMNEQNTIVHAVGMEMDNKTHILKLLSHVRSEHLPHAK
ncbi:MAG: LPS export ABC transporter periplasmic protein LptC [Gallionella sp.]|jgi:lipopolysaccharide export system protein LptC